MKKIEKVLAMLLGATDTSFIDNIIKNGGSWPPKEC